MEKTTSLNTYQQVDEIELVEQARRGDKPSLNRLAEIARERLRVYVYRLTQNDDLAQEIVQESLLEMCKILGKLQKADRFWPWLYGIATNKLHRHYRTEKAMRHAAAAEERRRGSMEDRQEGLEDLVSEELRQIVSNAVQKLRTRHKAVLVMRCYDGMSYSDIAASMGCNEFSVRMVFVRAKKALQKELLRNGFGRGSLLAALVVFGKITAPSKAVAAQLTVPPAALKVGLAAGVAGLATSTTGIVSLAAAGALTVGTVVTTTRPPAAPVAPTAIVNYGGTSPYATSSTAHEQYWYGFPDGPQGPMWLRAQSRTSSARVLQNWEANFTFQGDTVAKTNYRMWLDDLSVFKLPTDSTEMRGFLAQVEGIHNDIPPFSAGRVKDLLIVAERETADAQFGEPWTMPNSNLRDSDYFESNWPAGTEVVDRRDAMHQRGWAYFRIRGEVRGQSLTGTGRIPFVYDAAQQHSAWLQLKVGDDVLVVDSGPMAVLRNAEGEILGRYLKDSFFAGLSRPWMGLHTIDSVRRDAAEQRAPFETQLLAGGQQAQVTIRRGETRLVYLIDLKADLVRQVGLFDGSSQVGSLQFEYLEGTSVGSSEFTAPAVRSERASLRNSPGILWLVLLANGHLGG